MDWISIKDRLPDYQVALLVYRPQWKGRPIIEAYFIHIDRMGNQFVHDMGEHDNHLFNGVTHWMPLPEPPKEEE